jgi:hypothetical protein
MNTSAVKGYRFSGGTRLVYVAFTNASTNVITTILDCMVSVGNTVIPIEDRAKVLVAFARQSVVAD